MSPRCSIILVVRSGEKSACLRPLAGAHLGIDKEFVDGFFVFLYPRGNHYFANAVENYRQCLTNETSFTSWTLEDFYAAVEQHSQADWIDRFFDRYLDFAGLEQVLDS